LLAAVLAVASVTTILRTELQRLLAEMVGRSATQQVVDASCRADLARSKTQLPRPPPAGHWSTPHPAAADDHRVDVGRQYRRWVWSP